MFSWEAYRLESDISIISRLGAEYIHRLASGTRCGVQKVYDAHPERKWETPIVATDRGFGNWTAPTGNLQLS